MFRDRLKKLLSWFDKPPIVPPSAVLTGENIDLPGSDFGKVDIVHRLASVHGYRDYLEFCTATTGNEFASIDQSAFRHCHRLMYRCPEEFDDGEPIDFRSSTTDVSKCLKKIDGRNIRYDIMLVDPFHTYEESIRDLKEAFERITPGGSLVVHDCLPTDGDLAKPEFIQGPWFGVTYKAYIDFVIGRSDLMYYTVDTDFGCGVIRKPRDGQEDLRRFDIHPEGPEARQRVLDRWSDLGSDDEEIFRFFKRYHPVLLNLISLDEFMRLESVQPDSSESS